MEKKPALLLAILLTIIFLVFVSTFSLTSNVIKSERETVLISRVIDGDTLKLLDGRTLRLLNINAPEKTDFNSEKATIYLKSFENKSVEIESSGTDKYNRVLARIYSPEYVNLEIVRLGLASKFLVQESELSKFASAENNAIKNSLGIWNKSKYYGCFITKIDKNNEFVSIKNHCPEINIKGWILKDESRKKYIFNNLSLGEITLHSLVGEDNSTDIFWNSKTDIWNNDRDSAYLFDSQGNIVNHETYGY